MVFQFQLKNVPTHGKGQNNSSRNKSFASRVYEYTCDYKEYQYPPPGRRMYSFDGINHDVTRLRSVYASLLAAIALREQPIDTDTIMIGPSPKAADVIRNFRRDYGRSNINVHNMENNDATATAAVANNGGETQTQTEDEKENTNLDVIEFDIVTPSKTSNHVWQTLSAYNKTSFPSSSQDEHLQSRDSDYINTTTTTAATTTNDTTRVFIKARNVERRVIEFIKSIGELAICGERRMEMENNHDERNKNDPNRGRRNKVKWGYAHTLPYSHYTTTTNITQQSMMGDSNDSEASIFEYFCDKNMLSLFVDIVKARPYNNTYEYHYHSSHNENQNTNSSKALASTTATTANNNNNGANHNVHQCSYYVAVSSSPQFESSSKSTHSAYAFTASKAQNSNAMDKRLQILPFNGVVWSARVKAQVIQTIQVLISHVQDPKSLYYLLSNNYINELISSILPLSQWSDHALVEILPTYCSLLKTLTSQLAYSPHLFQFFCQTISVSSADTDSTSAIDPISGMDAAHDSNTKNQHIFPLFQAAVEVASSTIAIARNDIYINTTALDVILHLSQIKHNKDIQSVISASHQEQRSFALSLCLELKVLFDDLVECILVQEDEEASGPTTNSINKTETETETETTTTTNTQNVIDIEKRIDDKLIYLKNLLWCSVRAMNMILCECVMQHFIYKKLFQNILLAPVIQEDTLPHHSVNTIKKRLYILSQTSIYVLTKIFTIVDYAPLLKMASVALLHPYSPQTDQIEEMEHRGDEFIMTPALNAIAQNDFVVIGDGMVRNDDSNSNLSNALMEESTTFVVDCECSSSSNKEDEDEEITIAVSVNRRRSAIIRHLAGDFGCKGFVTAAALMRAIIAQSTIGFQMLKMLEVVPDFLNDELDVGGSISSSSSRASMGTDDSFTSNKEEGSTTSFFEEALGLFLSTLFENSSSYIDKSIALSVAASLSTSLFSFVVRSYVEDDVNVTKLKEKLSSSLLLSGIKVGREKAVVEIKKFSSTYGTEDLLPELVEVEIQSLFHRNKLSSSIICNLEKVHGISLKENQALLSLPITKGESPEIKDATFLIRKIIIMQLIDQACKDMIDHVTSIIESKESHLHDDNFVVNPLCPPSEIIIKLGSLQEQIIVGSELDITRKTLFSFSPSLAISDTEEESKFISSFSREAMITDSERRRQIADKILLKSSIKAEMMLVVDPEGINILKPNPKSATRGTVLCSTIMRNILGVASDGQWLHIAIRNVEDIGVLVQKGNMALRFKSSDICKDALKSIVACKSEAKIDAMKNIEKMLQ